MADNVKVGIVVGAAVGSSVGRAFGSVAERSRQVGDALNRTNQRADRHRQELRRLRAEQARTGDESGQLAREIRHVGEVLRRTTERAGAYRRQLRELQRLDAARASARGALFRGGALLGAGYAVQRLIGDAGMAHERAAAELRTVVQTDAEVVRALEHARRRVRGGAGTDETEQVQIHYELSSAGFSAEEARIGSVIAEQVAIATRGVPDETAKTIGTAYNLFREKLTGTTEENLRRVGDVLTQTQFTFQLSNLGALSAGFAEATKGAQQMNVGLEETATLVGLLNTLGLTDSRAGTSYNAIMRQLVPASRMLGFEIVRANDGGLDLAATLEGLAAALPEDTDRRAAIVQKAFGEEGAPVSLLLPKLDLYREGLEGANDALGVTEEAWARILATTGERVAVLGRRAQVARNAIGEALQAPIGDTADRLGEVANWIGRAAEESPQLIRDLGTIALGIGGVVAASVVASGTRWVALSLAQGYRDLRGVVGGTAGRLGRFAGALGRLSGVTRLAAAVQWLWNAALLANPIGATVALVVAGAALIGGAVYLVYKHWEPIKAWFSNLWTGVVEIWSGVFTDFSWFDLSSWATLGAAIVKTLVGGVVGGAKLLWDGVGWVFEKVRDLLPFSDAREGPFSRLTASGGAILRTIGDGVARAGPGALRRPLAAQLGAAAAGLTVAVALPAAAAAAATPGAAAPPPVIERAVGATPGAAAPPPVIERAVGAGREAAAPPPVQAPAVVHHRPTYQITINAAAGEDASRLARRLMDEIERLQRVRGRAALHDEL